MPFFSIIIPVYNVAPYLRECLDSVQAQTFTDWEAICVDDGSTDSSGAILDEYAAKDNRFRVFHQENTGVGAARNRGLDEVRGNWICFVDGDDDWNRFLLEIISGAIRLYPYESMFRFGYEIIYVDTAWFAKDVNPLPEFNVIDISREISTRDFFGYLFWCYVYRRDLIEGIRFPEYVRGEDRCFLNKIQLERAQKIVATDSKLYGYRQRNGSAMHAVPTRRVLCDEMDHRINLVELVDSSGKKVAYSHGDWIVPYFLLFHKIVGYRCDLLLLWKEWLIRVEKLSNAKAISNSDRIALKRRCVGLAKWWYFVREVLLRLLLCPLRKLYRFIVRHGEFLKT